MKKNMGLFVSFLIVSFCLSLQACNDKEEVTVIPPSIGVSVSGYILSEEDVVTEGKTVSVRVPSINEEGMATDLTRLAVTVTVKNGYVVEYDNGSLADFSSPVPVRIEDKAGNEETYQVVVTVYDYVAPLIKIKSVSIQGLSLEEDALTISGHKVFVKVPTLTDACKATDYAALVVQYRVDDGSPEGLLLGSEEALDYSSPSGTTVSLTMGDITEKFQVRVLPVYLDKGHDKDPIVPFEPIHLNWVEQPDNDFPAGLKLFKVDELKPGSADKRASGYYAELSLSASSEAKLALGFTSGPAQNIKKWYTDAPADDKPFIISNGGFFSSATSLSLLVSNSILRFPNIASFNRPLNGVSTPYTPTRSAFGIMSDGSVEVNWVYNSGGKTYAFETPVRNAMNHDPLPNPMHDAFAPVRRLWKPVLAIGGAPVLVKNGEIVCTEKAEICDQFQGNRARTAIGITSDNRLILLVLDEKPSPVQGWPLVEVAQLMKTLGCRDALNLDGGGSSAMVVKGSIVNTPSDNSSSEGDSRNIPTVLMIKKK